MLSIKVDYVVPISDMNLLVFFENGIVKKFDVKPIIKDYPEFADLENPDIFNLVKVEPGGYGVSWTPELDCSEGELWENGIELPLGTEDFIQYIKHNTFTTGEAAEALGCSRQNVDSYLRRNGLKAVKEYQRTKLFLKSDVIKMK